MQIPLAVSSLGLAGEVSSLRALVWFGLRLHSTCLGCNFASHGLWLHAVSAGAAFTGLFWRSFVVKLNNPDDVRHHRYCHYLRILGGECALQCLLHHAGPVVPSDLNTFVPNPVGPGGWIGQL